MASLNEPYYVQKLQNELQKRKRKNTRYSLRSFAKLLDLSSSTLSAILKKKRPYPIQRIDWAANRLGFSQDESQSFYQSVIQERFLLDSRPRLEEEVRLSDDLHFDILSQWEYYALLTLFEIKNFEPNAPYISKKLGLSLARTKQVWAGLEKAGLITQTQSGNWKKSSKRFTTSEDVASLALRMAHLEELELGRQKLHGTSLLEKDYSSTMVAIPKKNLIRAKKLIRKFRKDFSELIEGSEADRVYLLAIQFFPLTKD
jgi:uncharacterized protein (TIGR02147 family)